MDVLKELLSLDLWGTKDMLFIKRAIGPLTTSNLTVEGVIKVLRPIEDHFEYRNAERANRKKVTDVIDAYVQTLR